MVKDAFAWTTCALAIVLTACVHSEDNPNIDIDGFVLVETVVPDWEERRKTAFTKTYTNSKGLISTVVDGSKTFICEGAEDRDYILEPSEGGPHQAVQLKGPRYERPGFDAPEELVAKISTFRESQKSEIQYNINVIKDAERWADGWMVAFARGEFGGLLLYLGDDGNGTILDDSNANDLLRVGNTMFVGQGVDHMFTGPEYISVFTEGDMELHGRQIATPSAVYGLAEQDGYIAGRLSDGIIFITPDQSVHYRIFGHDLYQSFSGYHTRSGFRAHSIGFLPSGDVWIGGENAIGVYTDLPNIGYPKVLIPEDCEPDFGDPAGPPIIIVPGESEPRNARPGEAGWEG